MESENPQPNLEWPLPILQVPPLDKLKVRYIRLSGSHRTHLPFYRQKDAYYLVVSTSYKPDTLAWVQALSCSLLLHSPEPLAKN